LTIPKEGRKAGGCNRAQSTTSGSRENRAIGKEKTEHGKKLWGGERFKNKPLPKKDREKGDGKAYLSGAEGDCKSASSKKREGVGPTKNPKL